MSLSSILDEIQGDAVNVAPEGQTDDTPIHVLEHDALEHLNGMPAMVEKVKDFGSAAMAKRVLEHVSSLETLDHVTAMEVFTMIAKSVTAPPVHALTASPSAHNRQLVLNAGKILSVGDVSHLEFTREVCDLLDKSVVTVNEISKAAKRFGEEFVKHSLRLKNNPSIVMLGKQSVDLFTSPISYIAGIDTFSIDYAPYEGKLDLLYRDLINDDELTKLVATARFVVVAPDRPSLSSVVSYLQSYCANSARRDEDIYSISNSLKRTMVEGSTIPFSQVQIENAFSVLSGLREERKILLERGCLADKVLKCLNFLE